MVNRCRCPPDKLLAFSVMRSSSFPAFFSTISLACALVRQPRILILDDSASALDYATDAALRQSLQQMPNRPTIFLVSQRTASLLQADRILVLDGGKLVGNGTHADLLETCPVYQEIYYSQFPKEEVQTNAEENR